MLAESDKDLPEGVFEATKRAIRELISKKSVRQYEAVYKEFIEWYNSKNLRSISENVILAHFEYKIKKVMPTTV